MLRPDAEARLNVYLVNHNAYAGNGMRGVLPYVPNRRLSVLRQETTAEHGSGIGARSRRNEFFGRGL